jgi:rhamnose transport system permease protein
MASDLSTGAITPGVPAGGKHAGGSARRSVLSRLFGWDSAIIIVVIAVLVTATRTVDNFGTETNAVFLVLDLIPLALIALPMTLIIVAGEIDLSVASTLGLTSAVMGRLWSDGVAIETIIPICLLLGIVLGAVNGCFITVLGLPSLAVTIGTLALFRGLAFVVLGDGAVADFPTRYTNWTTGTLSGTSVPNVLVPLLVLALIFAVLLHATPTGRRLFAAGANEQAARFVGTRVSMLKFWLYVVSGLISALAGIYLTLRYSSARADHGSGLELAVVASVLLGGVSIFGGRGTLWGVLAGVLLLVSLQNALRLADVSNDALPVVTGGLLIISVLAANVVNAISDVIGRRRRRKARRSTNQVSQEGTPT